MFQRAVNDRAGAGLPERRNIARSQSSRAAIHVSASAVLLRIRSGVSITALPRHGIADQNPPIRPQYIDTPPVTGISAPLM